jgi:Spy/CpxP family protein refolding chaperone
LKKFLILFFLTFFVFSSGVYAFADGGRFKWWKNPKIVEELNLSQNQVDRIENIFSLHRVKIINLDNELKSKEAKLRDRIRDPNSDREEILRLADEVEQIKGELRKVEVDMLLQIRDVLTPGQRAKLHEIKRRYRRPPD